MNKKKVIKRFFPYSPIRIFWVTLLLAFIILPVWVLISLDIDWGKIDIYTIFRYVCMIIVAMLFFIELLLEIKERVVLFDDEIYVAADKSFVSRKLQYEERIRYADIESIRLIASTHNSRNEPLTGVFVGMPYLILTCKDGNDKAINLYFYSRGQVRKMIDIIKEMVRLEGNELSPQSGKEMLKEFLRKYNPFLNKKKKRKKK